MDRHCNRCPYVCKMLDADIEPVRYKLSPMPPSKVIDLLKFFLLNYQTKFLKVEAAEASAGNQLALLLSSTTLPEGIENCFHVIAQAQTDDQGDTILWLRYGTPPLCCFQPPVVAELTRLIEAVIEKLGLTSSPN